MTEYFGNITLIFGDSMIPCGLIDELKECLIGSVLVLEETIRDFIIHTNGTQEFVDFSTTLNLLLTIMQKYDCCMIGNIIAIQHVGTSVNIFKFSIAKNEYVKPPVNVLCELEKLQKKREKLLSLINTYI